jgi:hypothetical protein
MPTTASTTATTARKTRVHGHCDLCYGRDGFREMKLLTCPDCGVAFHCECYGVDTDVVGDTHNKEYTCGACRSVGTFLRGRDHTGREHAILQTTRPTECSLCSVDEGIAVPHPMHPLYDNHGASGKQIVLPPDKKTGKPRRLAWVHTLCAMSITSHSSTGGCVYGCDADGKYKDTAIEQEGDGNNNNNKKDNPDATKRDQSVHHFVFCHKEKKDDPDSLWTQTIRERQALKCTLCGANDKNDDAGTNVSYRIPVQCSANDPAEFQKFKGAHNGLRGGRCFVPVHVGCAQWHKNDAGEYPSVTRVYFFPGTAQTTDVCAPPVINIFCDLHAQDLQVAKKSGSTTTRHPGKARARAMGAVGDKEIVSKPPEKVAARAATAKPPPTNAPTKVAAKGAPPARKMPATKKAAKDQHAVAAPEAKPHDNELCRKMVQDLVQFYRPLKNNKQRNRVRVARECYWKRQSNLSSEEFKVMWGTVKERVTEELATEETRIAVPATAAKAPTPNPPPRKRDSSKMSKAVVVDYAGGLEQHSELGDTMFRNAVIAMENVDIVDGAAVKAKMSEIRKSSRKSAKGLTLEKFRELWSRVKNAVADECGFRYAKSAGIPAGSKDGPAAQAGVSVRPEDVAERKDTRGKQGAQGGLRSEVTEAETTEASNAPKKKSRLGAASDTRENEGADGIRAEVTETEMTEVSKGTKKTPAEDRGSEITEVKIAEPSNPRKKRRLGGVSESKLPQYDINQKEQWYNEMVTGIQEAIMKPNAVGAPDGLDSILVEHKKRWMKQLGIRNAEFRAIWERVTQKIKSFKATPVPSTMKDWSFLVVGKNYNPDGIDFKTWDTYEEIASDAEELEVL